MSLMKSLLIGTLSLSVLSGCIVTNLMGIGDTEFSLDLIGPDNNNGNGTTYIAKASPQMRDKCTTDNYKGVYFIWGTICGFGKFPPEKIELQYAKWKPFDQIPHQYQSEMTAYADSLPESAWKTVTVYPRQFMSQVKSNKEADGTPILPGSVATKKIRMEIILDENGNVTLKDKYGYVRTSDML